MSFKEALKIIKNTLFFTTKSTEFGSPNCLQQDSKEGQVILNKIHNDPSFANTTQEIRTKLNKI